MTAKKTTFYKKEGRKYVPVYDYDQELMDAFPKGTHIVMCYPGGQSRRFNIDIEYAPLIAAGRVAEDAISTHIMNASALRVPEKRKPLTEEQRQAWKALEKAFGEERFALEYCSYREAAEEGVKAMQAEADKLLQHESVRKAYDHFLLMCKLVKENEQNS